ncbi:MAG: site-specific integrase [Candidatus Eremiobacteraeota bacterium]|nr:site-specific integrase [Candidatus Eremiobacteraeota bacterium]MCW5870787.1 site-specific integrase [Candidatus Eremiobacteraeota bacterium]
MAGQIIKRSEKVYVVRIFMGRDQRTGKRRYINKTIHGTKKDAQAYLTGALRDQDLGRFVEPSKVQLDTFLEQWLEEVAKPRLREATFHGYADVVRLYVTGKLGLQRVSELTPYKLQTYYAKLRELGVGTASLKKVHVVISSSLQQAVAWGLLSINPARSVVVANQRSSLREDDVRVLTAEEAKRFQEAAQAHHHGLALILALSTGMRPSEYLALTWKDIDLDQSRLVVQRSLYRLRKGGWRFEPPKTKGSNRTITLPGGLVELLREHRATQKPNDPELPDFVFRCYNGQPVHAINLRRHALRRTLEMAKLDSRIHLYSLRHAHATILLQAGVNPKIVAERLGHASVQMTLDVYSHVIPSMQQEVAHKVDGILF